MWHSGAEIYKGKNTQHLQEPNGSIYLRTSLLIKVIKKDRVQERGTRDPDMVCGLKGLSRRKEVKARHLTGLTEEGREQVNLSTETAPSGSEFRQPLTYPGKAVWTNHRHVFGPNSVLPLSTNHHHPSSLSH